MTKNKTKMISIRVSEDDYRLLKDHHDSHGNRSVSALAREALQKVLRSTSPPPVDLMVEVGILHTRLTELQQEVSRLARLVGEGSLTRAID